MRRIDHVGIAVRSIAESMRLWKDALGLEVGGTETIESEGVEAVFLQIGESRIELLEPIRTDSPVRRFIDKRGEGFHHISLHAADIEATLERLRSAGVKILGEAPRPGAGGSRVAFLHPKSCGGVLVELVEKKGEARAETDIGPGSRVLAYLREPQEKLWGLLRKLDPSGVVLEGVDLGSFDDWAAQIEQDEPTVVGPSLLFIPMGRIERLLLDRPSGVLPSLADRFLQRTGRTVEEVLG